MTPEQKRLVRDTWKQVVPVADAGAAMFYHRLFEIDPTTRELFRATDMVAQRKKLLQTLAFAIGGLDNLDALVSKVEDLGRRHAGYGVTDAHYDSVGAALLWTLEQGLGQAWTPPVAAAWSEVYRLLSGTIRNATARPGPAKRVARSARRVRLSVMAFAAFPAATRLRRISHSRWCAR
jgi:hemoglobin-like flavoprotein